MRGRNVELTWRPNLRSLAVITSVGSGLLVTACPVDERELRGLTVEIIAGTPGEGGTGADAGTGGDAGSNGAEGGTGGKGGSGGIAGTWGSSGSGGMAGGPCQPGSTSGASTTCGGNSGAGGAPTRCPDIDDNDVLDCDETLAENPTFDADTRNWSGETGLDLEWSDTDAHGKGDSGSLEVNNDHVLERDGYTMLGARQCFDITGGLIYHFAVEASVPSEGSELLAGFQLLAYDGPACNGEVIETSNSAYVRRPGWEIIEIVKLTGTNVASVALRLVVLKPYRNPAAGALFDNVLVKAQEP